MLKFALRSAFAAFIVVAAAAALPSAPTEQPKISSVYNSTETSPFPSPTFLTCGLDGNMVPLQIDVMTDNYPGETSWSVSNIVSSETVMEGGPYSNSNFLYTEIASDCSNGCFQFTIFDSYGDGICCGYGYGQGYYKVRYENELIEEGGGDGSFSVRTSALFGGGCPSNEPSASPLPSQSPSLPLPSQSPSSAPSLLPSTSFEPSASPSLSPSLVPSKSSPPSSTPSSAPSYPSEWWSSTPLLVLRGHTAFERSVCFHPNGRWLASASKDRTIKFWDLENDGEAIATEDYAHGDTINSINFNFDGTKLASGSKDGIVKIWNVHNNATLSLRYTLNHGADVLEVKFSPDGKYVASVARGAPTLTNAIMIWNVDEGGMLYRTLTGHTGNIRSIAFTPDGKLLASGSDDNTIRLWDWEDGSELSTATDHSSSVFSVDFSPDGAQLASGSHDKTTRIWNIVNSALVLQIIIEERVQAIESVKFSRDGRYLVYSSFDAAIKLWERHTNSYSIVETFRGNTRPGHVDISSDGQKIAGSSFHGPDTITIWGTTCKPGTSGTHNNCTPCDPGSYANEADIQSCIPCAPGMFQEYAGATDCTSCSVGTYQPLKGQTQCQNCRAGGYCSNDADVARCDGGFAACPIGTFNNLTGAHNVDSCVPCPVGTYSDNKSGLEVCFECPRGTYQDEEGKATCKVCGAGHIQNMEGQSICDNCPPGTIPDTSRSTCLECPKGTYSNVGDDTCSECNAGSIQSQTGQTTCNICPSGTFADESKVTCVQCSYRLGSEDNSTTCPFCSDGFYLKESKVKSEDLVKNPATFCLSCPLNAHCAKNTTIETLKGDPGFWRVTFETGKFYPCNHVAGVCLGGTSCARGHRGVRCEVCDNDHEYFDPSKGQCTTCPSFARLGYAVTTVICTLVVLLILRYIVKKKYRVMEQVINKFFYILTAIGMQAKLKICISFCQVVATFQSIYGVHMHSAFTSWFRIFDVFKFGVVETFGINGKCFGSMKARLLIGAGWPFLLIVSIVSGIFAHTVIVNIRRLEKKEALAKFLSRSLYVIIIIFYLVLPSVCQQIFSARTCQSFESNDSEKEFKSYLIDDWSIKCENGDADYDEVQEVFWTLFAIWPIAVPFGLFVLTLLIRPSVQSNRTTPLVEACRFLWLDYKKDVMFWEVIDLIRKITLTGLILFIDTEYGTERILRLLVAAGICVLYGTILSYARPYKRRDDLHLAVISNLLLTCFFLVSIIIHQCREGEELNVENICMKLFGFSDSYKATALAVVLTAAMLVAFVLFIFVQSANELNVTTIRLVSTNSPPDLILPQECKFHIFMSHFWTSGQDKVHKIVRMLKLYIQGVRIWLDVDVLENLSDLEKSVRESAHFILFYSEGYFKSVNCRREVVKAMILSKPITVMFESKDISVNMMAQMKEEFDKFWPKDSTFQNAFNYIFEQDPISWISKGLQFSLESIKLVAGRLLTSLPYYRSNALLLDAGMKIGGEIKPVEMFTPLDVLHCRTNIGASEVALKLAQECKGDIEVRAMNLSDSHLQRDDRKAVMLVYLNERVFQDSGCILSDSILRSIQEKIQVVLVHENDTNKGGCEFWQIMEQTPETLKAKPHSIYSNDIAVSLYSIENYEKVSLRQLLRKMGARPASKRRILDTVKMLGGSMKL